MSDHEAPDLNELVAGLPAPDAARRIEGLLATHPDGDDDVAAVAVLGERRLGDAVLEHLSLEALEGLLDRVVARLEGADDASARRLAWDLLDIARRPALQCRVVDAGRVESWVERLIAMVDVSHYTFGQLFVHRAASSGPRPLFRLADGRAVSWRQVAGRVDLIARGLLSLIGRDTWVAILSRNSLEMALADLACLSSGIVNVMIPATATGADVAYILRHSGVGAALVSSRELAERLLEARREVPGLETVIGLDSEAASVRGVVPLEAVLERAADVGAASLAERRERGRVDELATVMYTSGTTGTPKGICFSHRNIVTKRLCRALALPHIGEGDRLLAFLPLFHTFGRFLELTGCVFWGATYCFVDSPAIDSLTRQMAELRPTVFISIPLKWMELYERVRQRVDVACADEAEITRVLHQLTGGELAWGLSAAGYLDPDVFRFFQRQGVELMSGFGMTEATGGITMTSPGGYRDDSLGLPLPGIEIALAGDGELMIRGPYVMTGYLDPPDGQPSFDDNGFFHTGDLMERDASGALRIVDRKKEIYKNVKGQTVAPQKIENLFRDFESVGRVFLVGDHRPYNTALIYANPDYAEIDLAGLSSEELKAHFRSLVVTANSFLAPYERIVDFAVIDRDFDADRAEVTAKGTLRRKTIERHFADTIRLLYRRTTFHLNGVDVTVPNWLFQGLGITAGELQVEEHALTLASAGAGLEIHRTESGTVRLGSAEYRADDGVDLGAMLSTPRLWLGNEALVAFAPLEPAHRQRRRADPTAWAGRAEPYHAGDSELEAARGLLLRRELELADLHLAALLVGAEHVEHAVLGIRVLEHAMEVGDEDLAENARQVLRRAFSAAADEVVRRAFQVLALGEAPVRYRATVGAFLDACDNLFDAETCAVLVERGLSPARLEALLDEAEHRGVHGSRAATGLLTFLGDYGAAHPGNYRQVRAVLTRMEMRAADPAARASARVAVERLRNGFRRWLGAPSRIAVDAETGLEYRWEDVVSWADDVDDEARGRLLAAFKSTPVLREGVFLFAGAKIGLDDILPGGVWTRLLGADHGKSVYRVAVRTRGHEPYDLAVNLNRGLSADEIAEELDWLVVCSDGRDRAPLVEELGGYWDEHDLWTEEFIPGATLDRSVRRLERRLPDDQRFSVAWLSLAWSAMAAYVDFWNRSARTLVVADPNAGNVIVPVHDYQTGARLVSISAREPFTSLVAMLTTFRDQLVAPVEAEHPRLAGSAGWDVVLSALLEIVGEDEGLELLRHEVAASDEATDELREAAACFAAVVERRGFLPRRVFFAAKRYRRWQRLNTDATNDARARTLQELAETYGLADLAAAYPEARARYFRETVLRHATPALIEGLDVIIHRLRHGDLRADELSSAVADLRAHLELEADGDYFLARLSYPYLRPEDEVAYEGMVAGGSALSEMVLTAEDAEGRAFRIRHAVSPKEIGRLHKLFLAARLPVQFRSEHRFLVAVSDRGHVIGGLFYETEPGSGSAHMDKIVVAEPFRGKGVAGVLLDELGNRLRSSGIRTLTTGFFRPEFFYRYGFTVERSYAGLVRSLAASGS